MTSDQPTGFVDPLYSTGSFLERSPGSRDAAYKVDQLRQILQRHADLLPKTALRVADVGCGSGATTRLLGDMLDEPVAGEVRVDGYGVHPKVSELAGGPHVRFIAGDFCSISDGTYDLAVLFDVVEHVPDPLGLLRGVGRAARLLALHIPLDDSFLSWIRGLPHHKLDFPGHLLVLNAASALNLLSLAGLRVVDFKWSPVFRAPSGTANVTQRLANPVRALCYLVSPWLVQRLLGGVSVTVLARSPLAHCC